MTMQKVNYVVNFHHLLGYIEENKTVITKLHHHYNRQVYVGVSFKQDRSSVNPFLDIK